MLEQGKEGERRSGAPFARYEDSGWETRTQDEATERYATGRERREILARAREDVAVSRRSSWRSAG